jgi:hypothetical protein
MGVVRVNGVNRETNADQGERAMTTRYCDCAEPQTRGIAWNRCLKCGRIIKAQKPNCDMVDTDLCKIAQDRGKCNYESTHNVKCILPKFELKGAETKI